MAPYPAFNGPVDQGNMGGLKCGLTDTVTLREIIGTWYKSEKNGLWRREWPKGTRLLSGTDGLVNLAGSCLFVPLTARLLSSLMFLETYESGKPRYRNFFSGHSHAFLHDVSSMVWPGSVEECFTRFSSLAKNWSLAVHVSDPGSKVARTGQ